jgi:hypothetical protein
MSKVFANHGTEKSAKGAFTSDLFWKKEEIYFVNGRIRFVAFISVAKFIREIRLNVG